MRLEKYLFTSESVTEGHPDKIADQISDAILDEILAKDPQGRVAVEALVTTGTVFVAGEISTSCYVEIPVIVRRTLREIGYDDPRFGFDYMSCGVITAIQQQSPDIALGVDEGGAGDQGIMFGYATNETPEMMPLPLTVAHRITHHVSELRKNKVLKYLYPDGKSQVTVEYDGGSPRHIEAVVISVHHGPDADLELIRRDMNRHVIRNPEIVPQKLLSEKTKIFVNPTGRFLRGGPPGRHGSDGSKDHYGYLRGGVGSHGGGAFSGKDPTKVDRSGSYMARYIAKNIVAAHLAERCEIQLAYAIGVREPVSVMVNHFGTGQVSNEKLMKIIRDNFDLTPNGIIQALKLRRPIYRRTAAYGHFGRSEEGFTWEEVDKADELRRGAGSVGTGHNPKVALGPS